MSVLPPAYHPSEEMLFQHAVGGLPLARRVMVESHLSFCAACRAEVAELSRPGGRLLSSLPDAPPPPAALWQKIAARVAQEMAAPRSPLADTPLPAAGRAELPPLYQPLEWAGLGEAPARLARLVVDEENGLELYLIRNPPASVFPHHRHLGSEELLVLQGSISDGFGTYRAGDLQQYEKGSAHGPLIGPGETCWALTCIEGGVSFEG